MPKTVEGVRNSDAGHSFYWIEFAPAEFGDLDF
jgi:hypothetical protein